MQAIFFYLLLLHGVEKNCCHKNYSFEIFIEINKIINLIKIFCYLHYKYLKIIFNFFIVF